jgi:hypothetical protein
MSEPAAVPRVLGHLGPVEITPRRLVNAFIALVGGLTYFWHTLGPEEMLARTKALHAAGLLAFISTAPLLCCVLPGMPYTVQLYLLPAIGTPVWLLVWVADLNPQEEGECGGAAPRQGVTMQAGRRIEGFKRHIDRGPLRGIDPAEQ